MSVINALGVTLMGPEHHEEFLGMVKECLDMNKSNNDCIYMDAFASPLETDHFMVVSIWTSEDALMEWYKSPFHLELRKKGMQGMLQSYFTHLGQMMPEKSHQWTRPEKAEQQA